MNTQHLWGFNLLHLVAVSSFNNESSCRTVRGGHDKNRPWCFSSPFFFFFLNPGGSLGASCQAHMNQYLISERKQQRNNRKSVLCPGKYVLITEATEKEGKKTNRALMLSKLQRKYTFVDDLSIFFLVHSKSNIVNDMRAHLQVHQGWDDSPTLALVHVCRGAHGE